jgi:hypothetical protein
LYGVLQLVDRELSAGKSEFRTDCQTATAAQLTLRWPSPSHLTAGTLFAAKFTQTSGIGGGVFTIKWIPLGKGACSALMTRSENNACWCTISSRREHWRGSYLLAASAHYLGSNWQQHRHCCFVSRLETLLLAAATAERLVVGFCTEYQCCQILS